VDFGWKWTAERDNSMSFKGYKLIRLDRGKTEIEFRCKQVKNEEAISRNQRGAHTSSQNKTV